MVTLDSALDDIMKLDFASREMLLEILQKRQSEARREEMAKHVEDSVKEYRSGKHKSLSADEAIEMLNNL